MADTVWSNSMRNLGKASWAMLTAAGIPTADALKAMGAAAAFVAVKRTGLKPSANLLWALEGALTERDWQDVVKTDRLSLLSQVEWLESEAINH